jgi:hypothetical protein
LKESAKQWLKAQQRLIFNFVMESGHMQIAGQSALESKGTV